jgi:CheY-like chemotaxis protein
VKVSANIEIIARPISPESDQILDSSVLLVDDNPINLTLLRRCVKRLGRIDVGAINGQEALLAYKESHSQRLDHVKATNGKLAKVAPVRFILTDITMPVMDGLEFTRRVRAHERALDLKPAMIVALTALASPTARQEAYSSGIDLFLTKPVRFKDIEAIFAEWEADQNESVGN